MNPTRYIEIIAPYEPIIDKQLRNAGKNPSKMTLMKKVSIWHEIRGIGREQLSYGFEKDLPEEAIFASDVLYNIFKQKIDPSQDYREVTRTTKNGQKYTVLLDKNGKIVSGGIYGGEITLETKQRTISRSIKYLIIGIAVTMIITVIFRSVFKVTKL